MAQTSNRTSRARVAMELKLSILSALNKLGDRDTQQMAVDELQRIAENLSQDSVPVFLACMYDVGPEQKITVRKECVRMFATLATLYGETLSPQLTKMLAFLLRRLKDPDTQIRDVCVDTMGVLVARVPSPTNVNGENAGQGGSLSVYTKPLFDAMTETKSVQVGAAMCLGRVIENAPNLSPACIHRLAPRIIKILTSPSYMAKAALLSVIGSLTRAVKDSGDEHLLQLVPCVQEALQSSDWTARKAAAETLSVLACPGLSKMKASTLAVLDSYRFDKVKPVRDAVTCAIQVWKAVPGPETDSSLKLGVKNNHNAQDETPSFSRCWKEPNVEATSSPNSAVGEATDNVEKSESVLSDEKPSTKNSNRKRAPALSDLKPNPDFFRKLETKSSNDWQVEVAVPRGSPSQLVENQSTSASHGKDLVVPADNSSRRSRTPVECELAGSEGNCVVEDTCGAKIKASMEETASWLDTTLQEQREQKGERWDADPEAADGFRGQEQRVNGNDWILIQRQICQLERGQTDLLEMLQDFMCSCQENMLSLQDRVQRLERSVDNISQSSSGRSSNGGNRHLAVVEFSSRNRNFGDSEFLSSRFSKLSNVEGRSFVPSDRSGRESPYSSHELSAMNWSDSLNASMFRGGARGVQSTNGIGSYSRDAEDDDMEDQPPVARRAWDRGPVRHGEGPSARSVWRASKDEATLEAIRGAAGDELVAVSESEKLVGSAEMLLDSKDGEHKQAPSWLLWTRAMESLHAGDVDSAYEEALSAEDDLLLVRMMNQTGPVLDHFSNSTAMAMLRALIQILQQQHFLDSAFPWLQQVSELIRTKGPECLSFSMDAKRELVSSLHDTSALDFPERWMGNTVAKLALELATAWSIDLLE